MPRPGMEGGYSGREINEIIAGTQVPDDLGALWTVERCERREAFTRVKRKLDEIELTCGNATRSRTSLHTMPLESGNRHALILRADYHGIGMCSHVIVNDVLMDIQNDAWKLYYWEFAVSKSGRLFDYDCYVGERPVNSLGWTHEDIYGCALLEKRADSFSLRRGDNCELVIPDPIWNPDDIEEVWERREMLHSLEKLIAPLGPSTHDQGYGGAIQ